jgi:hypothetical protein
VSVLSRLLRRLFPVGGGVEEVDEWLEALRDASGDPLLPAGWAQPRLAGPGRHPYDSEMGGRRGGR